MTNKHAAYDYPSSSEGDYSWQKMIDHSYDRQLGSHEPDRAVSFSIQDTFPTGFRDTDFTFEYNGSAETTNGDAYGSLWLDIASPDTTSSGRQLSSSQLHTPTTSNFGNFDSDYKFERSNVFTQNWVQPVLRNTQIRISDELAQNADILKKAKQTQPAKAAKPKQVRWGRKNDKVLAKMIVHLLVNGEGTTAIATKSELDSFHMMGMTSISHFENNISNETMREVAAGLEWKGSIPALLERIAFIFAKPFHLSVREFKHLRKVYYALANTGNVNWEEVINHYPEKDPDFLIEKCKSLPGKGVSSKQSKVIHFHCSNEKFERTMNSPTHSMGFSFDCMGKVDLSENEGFTKE